MDPFILPLHHIRPKLLRPLDFPEKDKLSVNITKYVNLEKRKCSKRFPKSPNVLPIQAIVARYIAVAMLDKKTTA